MAFCTECGEKVDGAKFCPSCGAKQGGGGGGGGGGGAEKPADQNKPEHKDADLEKAIIGNYEYIRPSSGDKKKEILDVRDDKTCFYQETTTSAMQETVRSGEGTYKLIKEKYAGELQVMVVIWFPKLKTEIKQKSLIKIPGMPEGVSYEAIGHQVPAAQLAAKAKHGVNKWRVRK